MESETNDPESPVESSDKERRLLQQIKLILALKYAKTDNELSEIFPYLYLGSIGGSMCKKNLVSAGITHILVVADNIKPRFPECFTYKCVSFLDTPDSDLASILPECFDFIDQAQQEGGKVFLHCFAGKSRSPSVCMAYVMRTNMIRLLDAFKFVRERRKVTMPNTGFMHQLKRYEEALGIVIDN